MCPSFLGYFKRKLQGKPVFAEVLTLGSLDTVTEAHLSPFQSWFYDILWTQKHD